MFSHVPEAADAEVWYDPRWVEKNTIARWLDKKTEKEIDMMASSRGG